MYAEKLLVTEGVYLDLDDTNPWRTVLYASLTSSERKKLLCPPRLVRCMVLFFSFFVMCVITNGV